MQERTPLDSLQAALDLMSSALEDEEGEDEGSHGEGLLAQALREVVEAWQPQVAALRNSQGGLGHISERLHPAWL